MKKTLVALLMALFAFSSTALSQDTNSSAASTKSKSSARPPIFRATKEQVKQAQLLLKQRNLYAGEATGKLDTDTRAALKKYQQAETLKPTGTLNRATLEKMSITLTDRQKSGSPTGNRNTM